ncbi:MAG TPA: A24 family peptidase [Oscillospiraceae bacterium]|nr:A24 family peptidase [Oscillospiraceae bacterium]HPK34698.1 A24 family peptidase [Oscillospiraceae bacterium]HPR74538.1 A24 family peptidase [Oscillospiraceae bacterium]
MLQTIITTICCALLGAVLSYPVLLLNRQLLKNRGLESKEGKAEHIVLPIIMGLFGAVIGWRIGLTWETLYLYLVLFVCGSISCIDARHRIIPNELVFALLALTIAFGAAGVTTIDWLSSLGGFAACFVLFLLPALFSKKVGAGDIKLAAAMGFCVGLMGSLYAITMMGILVLIYVAVQFRIPIVQRLKTMVPMGPFLAIALIAVSLLS